MYQSDKLFQSLEQRGFGPCPTCGGRKFEFKAQWIITLNFENKTYDLKMDPDEWQEGKCLSCGQEFYGIPFVDEIESEFFKSEGETAEYELWKREAIRRLEVLLEKLKE